MTKILATGDIHIHDYQQFSELGADGINSRLRAYKTLAEDILDVARKTKCEAIVLAGDILHSPVTRPSVLSVAKYFLETLSSDSSIHLIVTTGQHDLDSKSGDSSHIHSILNPLTVDRENFHYCPTPKFIKIKDTGFYVYPWSNGKEIQTLTESKSKPKYKVFVGHGIVQDTEDLHGYKFGKGNFERQNLLKGFDLSVVGDIHKAQLIESKTSCSVIVVPGQPLQSNFSSSYPCGIWTCDIERRRNDFIPLNEIRDDGTYHFFIHVDDENKIKNRSKQYHYSIKRQKVPAKKIHQDESVNSTIPDIFESVLGKAKFDNKKLAREKFDEIYKTISSNKKRSISETSLVNLRVRNFISIRDYELDFSDWSGNLLIQGMNGTGKTSLLEAIYWWLTGKTTKEISVSEIVHLESKLPPSCEGELIINQKRYSLKRSRDGGANLNLSMIEKDGTSYSLDKGSVSETQELIYSLLGLNASEILSLIYFSLEKLNVFTNLGPSDKHDFMKKISDANAVDEISTNLNEQFGNASLLKQEIEAEIKVLTKTIEGIKERNEASKSKTITIESVVKGTKYEGKKDVLKSIEKDLKSMSDLLGEEVKDLTSAKLKLQEARNALAFLKRSINETKSLLDKSKEKLEKSSKRTCPECGQSLKDNDLAKKYKADIKVHESSILKFEDEDKEILNDISIREKGVESLQEEKDKRDKIASYIKDTERLKEKVLLASIESSKQGALDESTSELENRVEEKQKSLVSNNETLEVLKFLKDTVFSRSGSMVQELSKYSGKILEDTLNELAGDEKLFEAKVDVKKDIDIKVKFRDQNFFVGIAMMSAGQKRFLDILVLLALNKILSEKYKVEGGLLGFAIFDEIFTYLDPEYMETAYSSLCNLETKLKICVTHDERLKAYFDRCITVTMKDGYSVYS